MKSEIKGFVAVFLVSVIMEPLVTHGAEDVLENKLWKEVAKHPAQSRNKVTIVGSDGAAAAVAFSLISQLVADEIVLIGRDEVKTNSVVRDLQDGAGFVKSPRITGGTDYSLTKDSKICIVMEGTDINIEEPADATDKSKTTDPSATDKSKNTETLLQNNLEVFKEIIPKLKEHSPDTVYIIVTNPVDIMAYITWKLLGKEYTYKVLGIGTNLDTQRMRALVAKHVHVSPQSVDGWVLGEHGEHCFIAWSGVNVAGVNLFSQWGLSDQLMQQEGLKKDSWSDNWFYKVEKEVVKSASVVVNGKRKTNWAVSLSVSNLVYSILHNINNVHTVSVMVKGFHRLNNEVFMSLPCVLGETGVTHIIKQTLNLNELGQIKSAETKMTNIIKKLKWDNPKPKDMTQEMSKEEEPNETTKAQSK